MIRMYRMLKIMFRILRLSQSKRSRLMLVLSPWTLQLLKKEKHSKRF
jgi:hypothetical protein